MAGDDREVTFFTQAARRALRVSEGPAGERLPVNPSVEQIVAFVVTALITGPPALVAEHFVWGATFVGFFVIPFFVAKAVGTIQDGGNAPAVTAHNFGHAAVSWLYRQYGRLQRPERFDGKTRIVRDR